MNNSFPFHKASSVSSSSSAPMTSTATTGKKWCEVLESFPSSKFPHRLQFAESPLWYFSRYRQQSNNDDIFTSQPNSSRRYPSIHNRSFGTASRFPSISEAYESTAPFLRLSVSPNSLHASRRPSYDFTNLYVAEQSISLSQHMFEELNSSVLGYGASASVRAIRRRSDGQPFAAKEYDLLKHKERRDEYRCELGAMTKHRMLCKEFMACPHHLVEVIGILPMTGGGGLIVMELMDGAFSVDSTLSMDDMACKAVAFQMAHALSVLHKDLGLVHRDVKPQNFLYKKDTGDIKLSDFGLSMPLLLANRSMQFLSTRGSPGSSSIPLHSFNEFLSPNTPYKPPHSRRDVVIRQPTSVSISPIHSSRKYFPSPIPERPPEERGTQRRSTPHSQTKSSADVSEHENVFRPTTGAIYTSPIVSTQHDLNKGDIPPLQVDESSHTIDPSPNNGFCTVDSFPSWIQRDDIPLGASISITHKRTGAVETARVVVPSTHYPVRYNDNPELLLSTISHPSFPSFPITSSSANTFSYPPPVHPLPRQTKPDWSPMPSSSLSKYPQQSPYHPPLHTTPGHSISLLDDELDEQHTSRSDKVSAHFYRLTLAFYAECSPHDTQSIKRFLSEHYVTTSEGTKLTLGGGSISYMAPERLKGDAYDHAADIWSLGFTIATIALGHHPFHAQLPTGDKERQSEGRFWQMIKILGLTDTSPPPNIGIHVGEQLVLAGFSRELADVVARCLEFESSRRPTAADLCEAMSIWDTRDHFLKLQHCLARRNHIALTQTPLED